MDRRVLGIEVSTWKMIPVVAAGTGLYAAVAPPKAAIAAGVSIILVAVVMDLENHPRVRARRHARAERNRQRQWEKNREAAREWQERPFEVRHRHSVTYGVDPGWPRFRDLDEATRFAKKWTREGKSSDVYDVVTGNVVDQHSAREAYPEGGGRMRTIRKAIWPVAMVVVGFVAGSYSSSGKVSAPSAAPCVAWSFTPEIPGYTPRTPAEEYIVRIDWQVYDRLFPGCDFHAILVATPDILIRAFRLENQE